MNEQCYKAVIKEMQPLLENQKFVSEGDIFKNETKAVKVEYRDDSKQFVLLVADVADGDVLDFSVASSWLFDETQTERNATSVGIDFADTLRDRLGVKKTTARQIDLPTVAEGENIGIKALTQKLLAIYPQHKSTYKETVAEQGGFLYLDFYATYFIPSIRQTLESNTKKSGKKLFDVLIDLYKQGDNATSSTIVALISAATFEKPELAEAAQEYLADYSHLAISVKEFDRVLKSNKKLKKALLK